MLISLFSDASYRLDHRLATWGTYHVRDAVRKEGGGIIKGPIHNSVDAEIAAIIKGFEHCSTEQSLTPGDRVIIQTDCQPAIHHLEKAKSIVWAWDSKKQLDMWANRERYYTVGLPNLFWMLVYRKDVTVEFRHVPGHVSHKHRTDKDPQRKRTWANQRCDTLAGNYMARALEHLDRKKTA